MVVSAHIWTALAQIQYNTHSFGASSCLASFD